MDYKFLVKIPGMLLLLNPNLDRMKIGAAGNASSASWRDVARGNKLGDGMRHDW